MVWGTQCGGADCPGPWSVILVGDTPADTNTGDTIVWGSDDAETIVWGSDDSETIVWGSSETDDTIVWGSCRFGVRRALEDERH